MKPKLTLKRGQRACHNCGEAFTPSPKCYRKDGQRFCKDSCRKGFWKAGGGARVQKWMREAIEELRADLKVTQEAVRQLSTVVGELRRYAEILENGPD